MLARAALLLFCRDVTLVSRDEGLNGDQGALLVRERVRQTSHAFVTSDDRRDKRLATRFGGRLLRFARLLVHGACAFVADFQLADVAQQRVVVVVVVVVGNLQLVAVADARSLLAPLLVLDATAGVLERLRAMLAGEIVARNRRRLKRLLRCTLQSTLSSKKTRTYHSTTHDHDSFDVVAVKQCRLFHSF